MPRNKTTLQVGRNSVEPTEKLDGFGRFYSQRGWQDVSGGSFSFHLSNVSPGDARFLGDVCALFCDPARALTLDGIRQGTHGIYRDPDTDTALVTNIFTAPKP